MEICSKLKPQKVTIDRIEDTPKIVTIKFTKTEIHAAVLNLAASGSLRNIPTKKFYVKEPYVAFFKKIHIYSNTRFFSFTRQKKKEEIENGFLLFT